MSDWQPIETAPKDDRLIIVLCSHEPNPLRRIQIASRLWPTKSPSQWYSMPGNWRVRPTHWMPLPEPPKQE